MGTFQLPAIYGYYIFASCCNQNIATYGIPYEHSPDAKALVRAQCAMHAILLDWVNIVQETDDNGMQRQPRTDQIESCYQRLSTWRSSANPNLNPNTHPTQANILFAMLYNVHILSVFQPFLNRKDYSEEDNSYRERARMLSSTSLRELRRLITLHETHHGWANAITLVIHAITVASFGTLDELSPDGLESVPTEKKEAYQGLLTCLRALSVLLSYSYYAQPLFRLLTQKCQEMGMQLPVEVQGALDFCMSEEWTRNAASLVSSHYIAGTRKAATDADKWRMDAIISQWETLNVDDGQQQ